MDHPLLSLLLFLDGREDSVIFSDRIQPLRFLCPHAWKGATAGTEYQKGLYLASLARERQIILYDQNTSFIPSQASFIPGEA